MVEAEAEADPEVGTADEIGTPPAASLLPDRRRIVHIVVKGTTQTVSQLAQLGTRNATPAL